ncbi:MAG: hypothetical protein IJL91_05845 [Bacteroidales bacterium]|nr:hypothetical protein [Bacteroidales bacterium]MBQ6577252.1 hypothetical protein [Bacteroidales bacterium]
MTRNRIKISVVLLSAAALLFLFHSDAKAAGPVESFLQKMNSSLVEFTYSFSTKGNMTIKGDGKATVQGDSFFVDGNGMEIYCDGKSRWTVDSYSKEAIIEDVSEVGQDFLTNPAAFLSSFDKVFGEPKMSKGTFSGKSADVASFLPIGKSNVSSMKMFFAQGELLGAELSLVDGSVTEFKVSGMNFLPVDKEKVFSFKDKDLDSSWVVTDLR